MNGTQQLRAGPGPVTVPAGNMYAGLIPPSWLWVPAKRNENGVVIAPPQPRPLDFFAYGVDFLPIASGATVARSFAVENDSDFLMVAPIIDVRTDAAPPVRVNDAAVLVRLTAAGSGRNLFNQPMPIGNVFGGSGTGQTGAELPAYLPFPKLMVASSTFEVQLTNNQGVDLQIRTTFWGFKIFDR